MQHYLILGVLISLLLPANMSTTHNHLTAPLGTVQAGMATVSQPEELEPYGPTMLATHAGDDGQAQKFAHALVSSTPSETASSINPPMLLALLPTATDLITGTAANGVLGTSVSTAGDVNGDGFSDVIVGIPRSNEAAIYFGTASGLNPIPTTLTNSTGSFGTAVSTAGDVDRDGFADVIVGSPDENRFYIYYGASGGLAPGRDQITGAATSFGSAVATAGDVNGDRFSDVLVGAPDADQAFIYFGSASGISTASSLALTAPVATSSFGSSVDTAGDVNNDGFADVIIGAPEANAAYVYLGAESTLPTLPTLTGPVTLSEGVAGDDFGSAVAAAGDVTGDGISDVLVGAPTGNKAYIFQGENISLPVTPTLTLLSTLSGTGGFGTAVSTAGDIDSDGLADVIIGAPETSTGNAVLHFGAIAGPTITQTITGTVGSGFGAAVNTAGDVNGDGFADIIVGAPNALSNVGQAALYTGAPDLPSPSGKADWTQNGKGTFGQAIDNAGDVNGDGYMDVLVSNDNGDQVFVYHGSPAGLSSTPVLTITNILANALFGFSLGTAGDVNGDGYADIIVGAPGPRNSLTEPGLAYIYPGSPTGIMPTPIWTVNGEAAGDSFGASVSTAGDVNGDGYADVVVGAPGFGIASSLESDEGKVYVYYGGPSGPATSASWTAESNEASAFLGNSVAMAGDVNRDGFSDIIAGAPGATLTNSGGRILLFYGSSTGLDDRGTRPSGTSVNANWNLIGQAIKEFGWSANTAGDVNGDGYADVIINARNNKNPNPRDYVFYGRNVATLFGTTALADWSVTVQMALPGTDSLVNTAGDVNGDGYADVIIGSKILLGGDLNDSASLYLGGPGGLDTTADAIFRESKDELGWSVAGSDVNGDGYADVLVSTKTARQVFAYYGNTGGVPGTQTVRPRQLRLQEPDIQIAPLGNTDVITAVRLSLYGRMPLGRSPLELEWQVAPLGTSFDDVGVVSGTRAVSTTGSVITPAITELTPGTNYHWRVRLRYPVGNRLGQVASRWIRIPLTGDQEQNFRTRLGLILVNNSPRQINRTTTFTATFGGGGAVPLTYTWDFDINTPPSGDLITTSNVAQHIYAAEGVYTARVTVAYSLPDSPDIINQISEQTLVTIIDTIPRLDVVNDSPTEVNGTTTFTATLGGIDQTQPVTYTWDVGDFLTAPQTTSTPVFNHSYNLAGIYTATVRADFTRVSGELGFRTATTVVTIEERIVGLEATNSGPTRLGSVTTLTATLQGGTRVQYFWDFDSDGITDDVSPAGLSGEYTAAHIYPAVGIYTATVVARNDVSVLTDTTEVRIVDVPVTGLTAENDSPTLLGSATTLTATITAGSNVVYTWDFENDGIPDAFSPPGVTNRYTAIHTYPSVGTYTARVTASNGAGTVEATTIVTITDVPIAGLTAENDSPTQEGNATTLTATITAGSNVAYTWDFEDDGTPDAFSPPGVTNPYIATHTYPSVGTYTARVTASNGAGTVEATTIVIIRDVPIAGLTAENDSPTRLGSVTTLTATITAGTNVTYTWDFENDGIPDTFSPPSVTDPYGFTGLYSETHIYPAVGTYIAVVTAYNGVSVVKQTTEVRIIDIPVAGIDADNDSPTRLGQATTLTVTITAGTNVTYTWDFEDDGRPDAVSPPGAANLYTVTHVYPTVRTYTARVTASNGVGSDSDTTDVRIVDIPIAGLTVESDSPTRQGNTTTLTATIVEGTNVQYLWDFESNGTVDTQSSPNAPLLDQVTHTYPTRGVYTATVRVRNGAGELSQQTSVEVIAPSLQISKSAPASVSATDRITYTITVSNTGNALASTLVITDVLPTGASFIGATNGGQLVSGQVRWERASLAPGETISVQLVVTATENLVNANYAVSSSGGFGATGRPVSVVVTQSKFELFLPLLSCAGGNKPSPGFGLGCGYENMPGRGASQLWWHCSLGRGMIASRTGTFSPIARL